MRLTRHVSLFILGIAMVATATAEEALPIRVEAEVVEKGNAPYLKVSVVNVASGDVTIRKELLENAQWVVTRSPEREDGTRALSLFYHFKTDCSGFFTEGMDKRLDFVKQLSENPEMAVVLRPGASHHATIPFEGAMKAAARDSMPGKVTSASLELRNIVLKSPDADEARVVALYGRTFRTPIFDLTAEGWHPAPEGDMGAKRPK